MKLCWIVTKLGTTICLYTPYKCAEFQLDQNTHLRVRADFAIGAKKTKKEIRRKKKLKL